MTPRSRTARLLWAMAGVALAIMPTAVQAQSVSAAALKAAFLLNFAQFVEWTPDTVAAGAPIGLCVVGDTAVADALESTSKGRLVEGHELAVRRLKADGPLRSCNVLYLSGLENRAFADVAGALRGTAVFTVSDHERFTREGGMAELFVESGRMRFAVNVDALQRSRVRLSSRVLGLAKIVRDNDVQ